MPPSKEALVPFSCECLREETSTLSSEAKPDSKPWDDEHEVFKDQDPIELLKSFMLDHELRASDLVKILNLSKGTISKILNYQKGLSKETIRKLSSHFLVRQEAFNRPYKLRNAVNKKFRDASLMNTEKTIE